jgi:hypothetical protein
MQSVPGGKVNILGGHSISNSEQKNVYVHVSYSERCQQYCLLRQDAVMHKQDTSLYAVET